MRLAARQLGCLLLVLGFARGQVSNSAYRVWGQPDFHQRGVDIVEGAGLAGPGGIALDSRGGQLHVYIADSGNSRVLAWADVGAYQAGQAPALILGQPGPQYSNPMGIGSKGFNTPLGLAVDPNSGNLFVADYGNSRVLRFPNPFGNPSRIEPDAVYGQPDFTTLAPNSSGVTNASLNKPQGVAVDSAGDLWVADTGNNRVVRFNAASLNSPTPAAADAVIGQNDFSSSAANRGGAVSGSGFYAPAGLAFDGQDNLYISDFNNARVLKFAAPLGPASSAAAATVVFGQSNLTTGGASGSASSSSLAGPFGLAVDGAGKVYVAVPHDNRVLIFPPAGGAASGVIGQSDFTTTQANAGVFPLASAGTLSGPLGVQVDGNGNVYVADTNNNRVLSFAAGAKAATQVWGQSDFTSNGVNQIKPSGANSPLKIAIDYSQQPFALYLSDTANNRVLVWKDAANYRSGDPADLVIGQPNLQTAAANVDTHGSANPTSTSLRLPAGMVVDAAGNLWVADAGNNRVLRFPRPVSQSGRITADVVLGQADMNSASAAAISASTLHTPEGLALGPDGDLFVADNGTNRVLEFAARPGTGGGAAIRVYGQASFTAGGAPTTPTAQS
ncbi:MAG TPA: NHL repeat-containing protein, partial [Bryobacteraceae bacterium]|nr:NHL repeat-containing protein [Bryobacteraceae bacterium]